jgi:hypothetical protein
MDLLALSILPLLLEEGASTDGRPTPEKELCVDACGITSRLCLRL